jgi:hypothetical protein
VNNIDYKTNIEYTIINSLRGIYGDYMTAASKKKQEICYVKDRCKKSKGIGKGLCC